MVYGYYITDTAGTKRFFVEGCSYCSVSTSGLHEANCPYSKIATCPYSKIPILKEDTMKEIKVAELMPGKLSSANIWTEYLEALERCVGAIKLTAYYTKVAAEETRKAAEYTLLTAYNVKEYLKKPKI